MAVPQKKPAPKRSGFTPEEIAELDAAYKEVAIGDDDETIARRKMVLAELRRVRHDDRHPDEPLVQLEVPKAVDGSLFKINEVPYLGLVTVPQCVAMQLASMIDLNVRVDQDRMRDRGNIGRPFDLGVIAQRARAIQEA